LENTTYLGVGKKIEIYVAKNIVDRKHNHGPSTTSKIEANNKIKKLHAPLRREIKETISPKRNQRSQAPTRIQD
jgi:hypothetical protein